MYSIFDASWEQVGLDHLRRFLADAGEEGVTWEAKAADAGDEDRKPRPLQRRSIRNGVCALANQVGGYFVVGARRVADKWELVGIDRPSDDPGLWLDQVLRGLQPLPRYDHHVWELDDDRIAAVIRVEPLTQTPCMTRDGQVFERTSSETVRVVDPVRLRDLFERGEQARQRAEAGAHVAATELLDHPDAAAGRSVWIGVGLTAGSYEPDISSRLFHSRFHKSIHRHFAERLVDDAGLPAPAHVHPLMRQDSYELGGGGEQFYWVARAHWSGRVGVLAAISGDLVEHHALLDGFVLPAWRLATDLVEHVGGYGDARVQVSVRVQTQAEADKAPVSLLPPCLPPPKGTLYAKLPRETHIRRPTELRPPSDDEIGSIQRELNRAAGLFMFEGVPDPPG